MALDVGFHPRRSHPFPPRILLDCPSVDFPVDFSLGVVNFSVNLSVGERGVACDFFRDLFFTIQTL